MNYSISPDRRTLTITADEGERANLYELGDDIHSDRMMYDVLEHITCNSELGWIDPSETGDLTDAPMLGILGEEGDKGDTFPPHHGLREVGTYGEPIRTRVQPILERWAFMSYQVRSLLQALRDDGEAVLVSGN